jgi:hypothetical protein
MARKRATLADLLNELTFKTIYDKFKMIALNIFEWEGLPDGIEEKHVEQFLFDDGAAIFFRDPEMSYMCLKADVGQGQNVYGEPLGWWATGFGYHKYYDADKCVIISNNKPRIATANFIMFYANKLAEVERTADVNVKSCKTPFIFACDDKDVLSFKQIFAKVDGNEPAVYADRGLNLESLQVFQTGVKFLGNDLQDYKHTVENELLTFLGVNNVNVDKKERLITDEAEANDELIQSFCDIQLEARERACKEINEMFGLNVSVKFRRRDVEKSVESVEKSEEGDDV